MNLVASEKSIIVLGFVCNCVSVLMQPIMSSFPGFLFYCSVNCGSCENYSYTHLSRKSEFIKLSQNVDCPFN